MDYSLQQAGRAAIEFLVDIRRQSDRLEKSSDHFAERTGLIDACAEFDPHQIEALQDRIAPAMQDCRDFRILRMLRDWTLDAHGGIAMEAFEQIRESIEVRLAELQSGPTTIRYAPDLSAPAYWDGYEFHRSAGGWDGHDYMGFVHGELIHRKMVSDTVVDSIFEVRRATARLPRLEAPDKILEMGCGSAQYTLGLAEAWPDAELWACDLSPRQLEQAQRRANELGLAWRLFVAPAESTGLDGDEFDLVTSFAVLHELPSSVTRSVLAESFRLLRPGGCLLMADVRAYHALDAWERWKADFWNQIHGGDPYWREYATTDLADLATNTGFADAHWYGVEPGLYPFVLIARKPGGGPEHDRR